MKYTEKYTITSHDVDVNNNLKPSMVVRYMQECANHQMRDRKPTYYELFFQGKALVVTRMSVEIYDQGHQYDEITVKTWRCPEKAATFIRCYSIERGDKVIAKAYSEWAIANRNTGKLCRASEIDLSNYDTDEPLTLNLKSRFRLPKDVSYEKVGTRQIMYSDVDMNLHMNNTNYPNLLCDYIPDILHKKITSMNLRFMKEGTLDAKMDIYMGKAPETSTSANSETYLFASRIEDKTNIEAEISVSAI